MYVCPDSPIVREAMRRRAVGIARDALAPTLDAAVARGLSRDEALAVGRWAISEGPEHVVDRVSDALDVAIEGAR